MSKRAEAGFIEQRNKRGKGTPFRHRRKGKGEFFDKNEKLKKVCHRLKAEKEDYLFIP